MSQGAWTASSIRRAKGVGQRGEQMRDAAQATSDKLDAIALDVAILGGLQLFPAHRARLRIILAELIRLERSTSLPAVAQPPAAARRSGMSGE